MQEAQGEDAGYGQDGAEGGVLRQEDAHHDEGEVGQNHGAGEPEIAGGGVGLTFAVCPEHAPGQHQPAADEPAQGGGRHIPEQGACLGKTALAVEPSCGVGVGHDSGAQRQAQHAGQQRNHGNQVGHHPRPMADGELLFHQQGNSFKPCNTRFH